ncbi:hypothetical protein TCAL_08753 [Tigriopus californicus]|uniref:Uncharacterized protein n=1 Tax=Tigriopus californicus TaxID=6832 RepID=A0A553PMC1_TIGCA|nr:hypothetical protein TCAL_08753 [Tigriopus californicus]|eukprot:TCALIF_08753-PA protein Name:"Protein of unknown function" AED:0.03 eAED:0.03 QI:99/0.8/0.83/1/0.6/0.66/6/67/304
MSRRFEIQPCDSSKRNNVVKTSEQYDIRAGTNLHLKGFIIGEVTTVSICVNHGEISAHPLLACSNPDQSHATFPVSNDCRDQDFVSASRAFMNDPDDGKYYLDNLGHPRVDLSIAQSSVENGLTTFKCRLCFLCLSTETKSYGRQENLKKWSLQITAKRDDITVLIESIPIQVLRYPRANRRSIRRKRSPCSLSDSQSSGSPPSRHSIDTPPPLEVNFASIVQQPFSKVIEMRSPVDWTPFADAFASQSFNLDIPQIEAIGAPDRQALIQSLVERKREVQKEELKKYADMLQHCPLDLLKRHHP